MTTIPTAAPPSDPYPVLVSFADRAKQRRWTVLLRVFLALPLIVVTLVFSIANAFVLIVGWFGALILGRTPKFARSLTTITLRLSLRLSAYESLLNDRFPSFALEDRPEDMVRMAIPESTRMNRWAVFFRIILGIPVGLLSAIVQMGSIPFRAFGWIAALITGWLPTPIHDLNRAVVRYQTRVSAYGSLLVPTYPGKLFGDPEPPTPLQSISWALPEAPEAPEATLPPPPPAAFSEDLPSAVAAPTPAPTWAPPAMDVPPAAGLEHPGSYPAAVATNEIEASGMHPSWLLLLGRGGKRLLVIAVIIGVPIYGAYVYGGINRSVGAINDAQLIHANNTLVGQINQFANQGRACQNTTDVMGCVEANDGRFANQLTSFAHTLSNASNTDISQSVISNAQSAATRLAQLFRQVSDAGSNTAKFKNAANVTAIDNAATNVLNTLNALRTALNNS